MALPRFFLAHASFSVGWIWALFWGQSQKVGGMWGFQGRVCLRFFCASDFREFT